MQFDRIKCAKSYVNNVSFLSDDNMVTLLASMLHTENKEKKKKKELSK